MALRATVHKVQLEVADVDRAHYATYALTVAKHPSETDERVMIRLVAFALNAHEHLSFAGGLSSPEEPALWIKDLTGAIDRWIEVGQPDPRVIRKASSRATTVRIYTYGRGADVWWSRVRDELSRFERLDVFHVEADGNLAGLLERNTALHALVQEEHVSLSNGSAHLSVQVTRLT